MVLLFPGAQAWIRSLRTTKKKETANHRQTSAMSWNPGSWTSNKSEPTQTREQWKTTQDPAKRMQDALARLAELPDGGSDDNKRTKKRLYQVSGVQQLCSNCKIAGCRNSVIVAAATRTGGTDL